MCIDCVPETGPREETSTPETRFRVLAAQAIYGDDPVLCYRLYRAQLFAVRVTINRHKNIAPHQWGKAIMEQFYDVAMDRYDISVKSGSYEDKDANDADAMYAECSAEMVRSIINQYLINIGDPKIRQLMERVSQSDWSCEIEECGRIECIMMFDMDSYRDGTARRQCYEYAIGVFPDCGWNEVWTFDKDMDNCRVVISALVAV
jgi:hypothetical protein